MRLEDHLHVRAMVCEGTCSLSAYFWALGMGFTYALEPCTTHV